MSVLTNHNGLSILEKGVASLQIPEKDSGQGSGALFDALHDVGIIDCGGIGFLTHTGTSILGAFLGVGLQGFCRLVGVPTGSILGVAKCERCINEAVFASTEDFGSLATTVKNVARFQLGE